MLKYLGNTLQKTRKNIDLLVVDPLNIPHGSVVFTQMSSSA